MKQHVYFVNVLASKKRGVLYIGVTNSLVIRVHQHKTGLISGFTERYNVRRLVYYEEFSDIRDGIVREKQLKKWYRKWKIELIETTNPEWRDLYDDLL